MNNEQQYSFSFDPYNRSNTSSPAMGYPSFAASLERSLGAARWVHNRAIISQWEAQQAGKPIPTLKELIVECLDKAIEEPGNSWLAEISRGMLIEELEEIALFPEDLSKIDKLRFLPVRRKTDIQEMVFPENCFTIQPLGELKDDKSLLSLDLTGTLEISNSWKNYGDPVAFRVERSPQHHYTATFFYGGSE